MNGKTYTIEPVDDHIISSGTLPDMLEMLLGMIGVPNIVGSDLFKNFEVVIDYANSRMLLRENN